MHVCMSDYAGERSGTAGVSSAGASSTGVERGTSGAGASSEDG